MSRRYLRSHFSLALAGAVAVLALAGCNSLPGRPGPDPEVVRPGQVLDFKTLYKQNCSACHGAEGKGGAAVSLADPVYLALIDDATYRRVTANGVPGTAMPAFARSAGGTLTDQQIDVLVRESRARWGKPDVLAGVKPPSYTASGPGDVARGAQVYETFCASCHGPSGKGRGKLGSIVDGSYLALVSDQGLRTTVLVGVPDLGAPDWRRNLPGRPMTDQEVSDVVAWLVAQRPQFPGRPYPSQAGSAGVSPALDAGPVTLRGGRAGGSATGGSQ
jgi:cytochrome c oxidase cbb3-type subunit III